MPNNRPLFSIVMPTRNRGHLLRYALQSALAQSFDDYEIVVSNNDSEDDTAEVIEEFAHPRLRSVRTTSALPMPDHWDFAAEHAAGEYLTYLCDDDALAPHALAEVAAALDKYKLPLVTMGSVIYHGANSINAGCRNCLQVPNYDGRAEVMDSQATLNSMATSSITAIETHSLPRMLNSFCHRDLFAKIRQQTGRIFLVAPDFSFAITSVASVPKWLYLHQPLWVCGCFEESTGMNYIQRRSGATHTFNKEMTENKLFSNTPLGLPLLNNIVTDTYLECKKLWPELLADFEVDIAGYFFGNRSRVQNC